MMKQLTLFAVTILLCFGFTSCGEKSDTDSISIKVTGMN